MSAVQDSATGLDWLVVAKSAGANGIRYRKNAALVKFLAEIGVQHATDAALREQRDELLAALVVAHDAIREMFRYFDGGETRGSYDGRPERNQLRKAGDATRRAIAKARS